MSDEILLTLILALPFAQAGAAAVFARPPGLRDLIQVALALALLGLMLALCERAAAGSRTMLSLAAPLPGVEAAFALEPLGLAAGALAAFIGALNAFYAVGWIRLENEAAPARLMRLLALNVGGAVLLCLSANLFSMFIALLVLGLASFGLMTHAGDTASNRAAQAMLTTFLTLAMSALLPALIWTYALAGGLSFSKAGLLQQASSLQAGLILLLFVLGIGAFAAPPLRRWLAEAALAPTPAPALTSLQALLVVLCASFAVLKITVFVFGPSLSKAAWMAQGLAALLLCGGAASALVALSRHNLRERLSHASLSQSALALAASLAPTEAARFGAALQILASALAISALTMSAGAIAAAAGRTDIDALIGVRRAAPWVVGAFVVAGLSAAGMPPLAGAWPKVFLVAGVIEADWPWAAGLAGLVSILSFAHIGPLAVRAAVAPPAVGGLTRPDAGSLFIAAPSVLAAAALAWMVFELDPIAQFLAPSLSSAP